MKVKKTPFSNYYTPMVVIKDFNVLIYGKIFFDTSIKKLEEIYENNIERTWIYDNKTGKMYWIMNIFQSITN